jgi:hypothetical protein
MIELTTKDITYLELGRKVPDKDIRPTMKAWWDLEGRWLHSRDTMWDSLVWYN